MESTFSLLVASCYVRNDGLQPNSHGLPSRVLVPIPTDSVDGFGPRHTPHMETPHESSG